MLLQPAAQLKCPALWLGRPSVGQRHLLCRGGPGLWQQRRAFQDARRQLWLRDGHGIAREQAGQLLRLRNGQPVQLRRDHRPGLVGSDDVHVTDGSEHQGVQVAVVSQGAGRREDDVQLLARRQAKQTGELIELLRRDLVQRQIAAVFTQAAQHFGDAAILLVHHEAFDHFFLIRHEPVGKAKAGHESGKQGADGKHARSGSLSVGEHNGSDRRRG